MKVAGLQLDLAWEDRDANFAKIIPKIQAAAACGARLVVLPEMFGCGFSMDVARIAEPWDGPSVSFLREQAVAHRLWIGGSVPERERGGATEVKPANTFIVAGPAGELHRYRKRHPFTFAQEHLHYEAGRELVTIEIDGLRATLFVCYDLRFANDFWDTAEKTDAYIVVANWPRKRRHHWSALLLARAIENQAYVVGINRVGSGGGLDYAGDSAIIDPWGEVLVEATSAETMLLAELDPRVVADARRTFPVLRDRHPA